MRFALILLAGVLLSSVSFAQVPSPQGTQFGKDMQSYFQHPDPQAIIDEFVALPASEVPPPGRIFILGAFFAQLINADPSIGDLLVAKGAGASIEVKNSIIVALNMSHHPHRIDLMRKLGGDQAVQGLVRAGFDIRTMPVHQPLLLDMLWASYFATGDRTYVDRIIEATGDYLPTDKLTQLEASAKDNPQVRQQLMLAVIGQAAAWSLTSNARTYPEVRGALIDFVEHNKGMAAAMAVIILAKTNPN